MRRRDWRRRNTAAVSGLGRLALAQLPSTAVRWPLLSYVYVSVPIGLPPCRYDRPTSRES